MSRREMSRRERKPSLKAREMEDTKAFEAEVKRNQKAIAAEEKRRQKAVAAQEMRRQKALEAEEKRNRKAIASQEKRREAEEKRNRKAIASQEKRRQAEEKREAKKQANADARKKKHTQYVALHRQNEPLEERQKRLQHLSQHQAAKLSVETPEERQDRLQNLSRKRSLRTPEEIMEDSAGRKQRRKANASSKTIEDAARIFAASVKEGPDYVCSCCHRLMYRKTVVEFKPNKYSKLPKDVIDSIFSPELMYTSMQQKVWVCKTCDNTLKRGRMPAQAKANSLILEDVPPELSDLYPLEIRLLSLRIPFMKMVALPCGKQRGIHGPAVNVPTDLHPVCDLLPRLPSEAQMVPMKLKRKLSYKGHYMFQNVRPARVLAALQWLKVNNSLYRNVQVNTEWEHCASQDDAELWEAFTSQLNPQMSGRELQVQSSGFSAPHQNSSRPGMATLTPTDRIQELSSTLASLARMRGFIIRDVSRDGNCLFNSVHLQLQKLGVELQPEDLRQQVATYLEEHPYTNDGLCHLREFISESIQSDDSFNADTEQPTEEDERIDAETDLSSRLQLRWCKYLRRLRSTAWGDHIAVQGLANMLHVDIDVIATGNPNMAPITTCHTPMGVLHLGLIGQFHYVSLDHVHSTSAHQELQQESMDCQELAATPDQTAISVPQQHRSEPPSQDLLQENREQAEDDAALHHQFQLRGLPYDTVMHREDVDVNGVFSVAPGEGQKPLVILTDEHFEEMSNPTKYPNGKFGLMTNRERKLTVRKYFNQRLLDADGRFARDIEYLLTAQYAVESKQVADDASIVLRQSQGRQYRGEALTAGAVKNQRVLMQMIQRDDAYRFLKNVRGSPAYFQRVMYDVLAMIRQLGVPTWFFTLSAADMQWPDVIQTIARQYGHNFTEEQVKEMSFEEKSKWLSQNPVTAARHFQYRLNSFLALFLKSTANPLGELTDHSLRVEFQARGSPHCHGMLWIKNAPKLNENTDHEVCEFINRYIHCDLPEDEELAKLVPKVQTHKHSATCRKTGKDCRFHYPRPPSPATIVAREVNSHTCSTEKAAEATAALLQVKKTLDEEPNPGSISLEELLVKAEVSEDIFLQGLMICSKGNSIVLKRTPGEAWINNYNPDVIRAWHGNMDIQFITDPFACVMYVCSYMLKSEGAMSELLRQVAKECRGEDIKTMVKRFGSVFLNHRELSAQEAVYRILSLPLKMLSRKVVFINTSPKEERVSLLKPTSQLDNMDENSEDIYQTSLIDRYTARPDNLDDVCLADFAANYTTRSGADLDEGDSNDTLPPPDSNNAEKCTRIKLKNGLGYMYKRTREAVIRFHRFSEEREANKMYRSKLMLYVPWRDENTDLLGGYMNFRSRYEEMSEEILANELKYSQNAVLISEAMDTLQEHGPPEHVWDQLAPNTVEQEARHIAEGVEEEQSIEQEDLDENARLFQQQQQSTTPLLQRFTAETNRELLSPEEYRRAIRGLNSKQRQVVMFHRTWCKKAVIALKNGESVNPYRVFVSGPGGVGKSHVISIIRSDTVKLLRLSGQLQPEDVIALLTAPTGSAAFNIVGMTLHSGLYLSTSKSSTAPLTQDRLNTLRLKLANLQLLIIDEISMVGSNMLLQIHRRLQQLKGSRDDISFGNVSILAVGDLYQLQPVAQPYIFDQVSDLYARLHGSGSLWTDEFSMVELDEIMRQRGDQEFAELLCRVRKAECTEKDFTLLRSREIQESSPDYPHDSLHVYRLNKDVDQYNLNKLNNLAPTNEQVIIHAIDCTKDRRIRQFDVAMPKSKANTGGLVEELHLAVGAKVMLTVNIDVSDGLVNGARGTVEAILKQAIKSCLY